jgi:glutamine---fructose-6-phosphate transaminase (isomerizing)
MDTMETIILPEMSDIVTPLAYTLPIQLIAYYTAVFMGTDVDQPRNLAKSVTVE